MTFTQPPLQGRHNERDGFSNDHRLDCLLARLFRRRSKETPKLCITGLCKEFGDRWLQESTHKGPVTWKMFHLMTSSWQKVFFPAHAILWPTVSLKFTRPQIYRAAYPWRAVQTCKMDRYRVRLQPKLWPYLLAKVGNNSYCQAMPTYLLNWTALIIPCMYPAMSCDNGRRWSYD